MTEWIGLLLIAVFVIGVVAFPAMAGEALADWLEDHGHRRAGTIVLIVGVVGAFAGTFLLGFIRP